MEDQRQFSFSPFYSLSVAWHLPGQPIPGHRHTVSWYIGHLREMSQVLDQCRDDPGDARNDPNCINAEAAKMKNDNLQMLLSIPDTGDTGEAQLLGRRSNIA